MISRDEVTCCGSVLRSHGTDGEVLLPVSCDFLESLEKPCLVLDMDGILVPFFIDEFRPRSTSSSLVKFDGIDSKEMAEDICGKKVWVPKRFINETAGDDMSPEMFVGLCAVDAKCGVLGSIVAVDDSTPNILFLVRNAEREFIIPANPELIESIDISKGIILFDLPEGIVDL